MSEWILLWTWLTPLLALPFAAWKQGKWLLAVAPLPALWVGVFAPAGLTLEIPWLLLGVHWGMDEAARIFLVVSSILYVATALYAAAKLSEEVQTRRYRAFFLLAMCGNLELIVSQDMVSFYFGFSLMSLCAYGILKPARTGMARHAARWYMSMAIVGEVALISGAIILNAQAGGLEFSYLREAHLSPAGVLLVIVGFGIKLGLPGLHMWMPVTYFAAPAPSVAILSSAMINAGILGLMRFLPAGNDSLLSWGPGLIVFGALGTVYGIVIGLLQHSPRSVLAYSSMSKMGTLTLGLGIALHEPASAPLITSAIAIYASHHALVKSALFLGADLHARARSAWFLPVLVLLALALAGAPFTSGAASKVMLKEGIPEALHALAQFLTVAGFATTLLMGRFIYLVRHKHDPTGAPGHGAGLAVGVYAALLILIAVLPFRVLPAYKLVSGVVPVGLGLLVIALFWLYTPQAWQHRRIEVPPGDILVVLTAAYHPLQRRYEHLVFRAQYFLEGLAGHLQMASGRLQRFSSAPVETVLRYWEMAGALWLAMCLGLIALLMWR